MKNKILKILKEEMSTSRIAGSLGMNYNKTLNLLNEMEKEKIVKSKITIRGRFWLRELKGGN